MNCRAGSTAGAGLLQRSEGRRVNKAGLGFLGEGGWLDCGTASHLFDLPGGFFFQLLTVGDVVGWVGQARCWRVLGQVADRSTHTNTFHLWPPPSLSQPV